MLSQRRSSNADGLVTRSKVVYLRMKDLSLKSNRNNASEIVQSLIEHFSNLRSLVLPLQLTPDEAYYRSLNALLDGVHLPRLLFLKTNWNDDKMYFSKVNLWLSSKTSLKWRLI